MYINMFGSSATWFPSILLHSWIALVFYCLKVVPLQLRGWFNTFHRAEFLQFLVDSHKAAYVPVCIRSSSDEGTSTTSEPAVVVALEADIDEESGEISTQGDSVSIQQNSSHTSLCHPHQHNKQPGRIMYSPVHKYHEVSPVIQKTICSIEERSSTRSIDNMKDTSSIFVALINE